MYKNNSEVKPIKLNIVRLTQRQRFKSNNLALSKETVQTQQLRTEQIDAKK